MIIGIDLDNIVVSTTEAVLDYVAERGAPKKTIADIEHYWIEKNYPPQYSLLIKEAFESKQMWKKIHLIEGAKEYIKKLYEESNEIYFVTSSLPENLRKKIAHLARNLDFFPPDYIFKHTINTQVKQLIRLDVLIDDSMSNLIGEKTYISICFDYPWNKNDEGYFVYRCKNWEEIYNKIHELFDESCDVMEEEV